MNDVHSIDQFVAPFGGQEIELLEVQYPSGGIPLLRVRIRERKRFTVFEIDPITAERWGHNMLQWGRQQKAAAENTKEEIRNTD